MRITRSAENGGSPLFDGLSVADFYARTMTLLRELSVDVPTLAKPYGVPIETPFAVNTEHRSYDRDAVRAWWDIAFVRSGALALQRKDRARAAGCESRGARSLPLRSDRVRLLGVRPYGVVREATEPGATLLDFSRSGFEAGTAAAGWDVDALASAFR